MNRQAFFAAIRPAFGSLSAAQVDGMIALLDAGAALPLHHMANVLAQARRETGGYMAPIKETVMPHHKDKNPSDAEVIRRLDRAFAAGKLKWVKVPYWRDGWFGRGQIQLTHRANYAKFGISDPADAMRPHISAHIAAVGMRDGMFTGKKLADYDFPADLYAPPKSNPRRIVNGQDGSDAEVAKSHLQFADALLAAGWMPATAPNSPYVKNTPGIEHNAPPYVSETPKIEHEPPVRPNSDVDAPPDILPEGSTKWVFGIGGLAVVGIAVWDRVAGWWADILNLF